MVTILAPFPNSTTPGPSTPVDMDVTYKRGGGVGISVPATALVVPSRAPVMTLLPTTREPEYTEVTVKVLPATPGVPTIVLVVATKVLLVIPGPVTTEPTASIPELTCATIRLVPCVPGVPPSPVDDVVDAMREFLVVAESTILDEKPLVIVASTVVGVDVMGGTMVATTLLPFLASQKYWQSESTVQ